MTRAESLIIGNFIKHYGCAYRITSVKKREDEVELGLELALGSSEGISLPPKTINVVFAREKEIQVYELIEPYGSWTWVNG